MLPGEEVTTYGGHINVWGLPYGKLIDFRVTPKDSKRLGDVLSEARKLGLPVSINHPTAVCGGCAWSYGDDWAVMDSVEVWNGSWDGLDELALKRWDDLLKKRQPDNRDRIVGFAHAAGGAKQFGNETGDRPSDNICWCP